MKNFVNHLERRLLRVRIEPFFRYIVFTMAGVFVLQWLFPSFSLLSIMALDRAAILRGELWRLVSFLVVPPAQDLLQTALSLYFNFFIGTALESRWGPRRFLIYYLFGALSAVAAAFLSGFGTNAFLNMSMFFAFALLNKDFQVLLFFILPVKMKWLAAVNALFFLASFTRGGLAEKAAILFSFVNLFLFFGGDIYHMAWMAVKQWKRRWDYRHSKRF